MTSAMIQVDTDRRTIIASLWLEELAAIAALHKKIITFLSEVGLRQIIYKKYRV